MASNGGAGLPFRFTHERHLKFVELYSREPCLWNRRPYLCGARNAAYKRIQFGINSEADASEIPISLQGVKMKIKNMRTGYHQELKKIRANSKYVPKIAWFAPLHKFLAQFLDKKKEDELPTPTLRRLKIKLPRLKPIKLPSIECEEEKVEVKIEPEPHPQVLIPSTALPLMPTLTPAPPLRLITPPVAQSASPIPPQILEVTTLATMPSSTSTMERPRILQASGEDEFTFFGLSVAAQLRSMPLSNAMIMQSKIQYMLSMERRRIGGDTTEANFFA